jgi:hypothetical protein
MLNGLSMLIQISSRSVVSTKGSVFNGSNHKCSSSSSSIYSVALVTASATAATRAATLRLLHSSKQLKYWQQHQQSF